MATFDYTSRDYLSIRQDLVNRAAQIVPEWNGNDASEFANVFVDLWAYMGDILHFYVDRAASETFLETATQRESVLAIANLLDYIPASYRAARGSARFTLNAFPTGETTYTIPQFTTLTAVGANGQTIDFYTSAASSALTAVDQQVSVPVVQGTITSNENVGVSNGLANQRFNLVKKNIDFDSLVVEVFEGPVSGGSPTAVQYLYVAQLSTANYLDKVFTARLTSDGYAQILFGNGFNGFIPTTNATIQVSYRTTVGEEGNLVANSIKFVGSPASSYVSIVSSTATSGGANEESIESIKTNVSRLFRTQDRAVSLQDYKDLTLQVPGVSKATATYASNVVTLYPAPHQTQYPPAKTTDSTNEKVLIEIPQNISESVELFLTDRSMLGVTPTVVNPADFGGIDKYIECTPVYIHVDLYVQPNYVQSWVRNEVDKAVRELLAFDRVSFAQLLSIGEVYRAILSVVGVDYASLINMSTTYAGTGGTVANIQADPTKLLCFSDDLSTPGSRPAIKYTITGGLTGAS